MKKTLAPVIVMLLVLCCSFVPADWIPFQHSAGRFKIMFPRQPKQSNDTVQTAIGPIKLNMFLYEVGNFKDDNAIYGIIYSDYPDSLINSDFKDAIIDTFFKHAISGAATNMQGTILEQKRMTFKGYPSAEAKISFAEGQGIMHMHMYLVKSRAYILEVGCEVGNDNNPSIARFFNSFDLQTGK